MSDIRTLTSHTHFHITEHLTPSSLSSRSATTNLAPADMASNLKRLASQRTDVFDPISGQSIDAEELARRKRAERGAYDGVSGMPNSAALGGMGGAGSAGGGPGAGAGSGAAGNEERVRGVQEQIRKLHERYNNP